MRRSTACISHSSQDADPSERYSGPTALYVHVPFCTRRCAYCDFATAPYDGARADAYLARISDELQRVPRGAPLRTIYVGGGTPTSLTSIQLARLLASIRDRLDLAQAPSCVAEWTVEANPETVDPEKVRLLRDAGVDRVSLGAQSFQRSILAALGREHDPDDVFRALDHLREGGIRRLSLDLMFGAPGETLRDLEADLAVLARLDIEHVSAYCLTYEPGTPLTRVRATGRLNACTDDEELSQYRLVRERLAELDWAQYEISNFARVGAESKHNLVYWAGEEYFGVGLGAGSYEFGTRRNNTRLLAEYLGAWPDAHFPPNDSETLAVLPRARERVVLGLRVRAGIEEAELKSRFGVSLSQLYPDGELEGLLAMGLLEVVGSRLRLTDRGVELADEVFVSLV